LQPYRPFITPPRTAEGERRGIFGLETEYAVLFLPDDPGLPRPDFALLQEVLFATLLSERKAAVSAGLKGGYFLQNGGLVHLEIYLRHQGDTPILEVATPECRSPWDLLVYSRAFDHLLEEVSRKSTAALLKQGFNGRIVFGKNNYDAAGAGFGCHENYLVHIEATALQKLLFVLALPAVIICLLPALCLLLVVLLGTCAILLLTRMLPVVRDLLARILERLRRWQWLVQNLIACYYVLSNALILPAIRTYSFLLRHLAFTPFTRDLTAFLVTRQIFTGSGSLNFKERAYELSQRPRLTGSLGDIVMFGKRKTMFDLKGLLYDPIAFFRPMKKLTISLGDSTLSDVPTLLKVGTTALIIEMIEKGETFDSLRLKSPVKAFRTVSLGGPWKQVVVRSGASKTAIEIQRAYLARARVYFARQAGGRLRHQEILDLWEKTLEALVERPRELPSLLDHAAKKSLLDRAVLQSRPRGGPGAWKKFLDWGHLFHIGGLEAAGAAHGIADLLLRAPPARRWRLRRVFRKLALSSSEFREQRDLYFQALKIDLRYHEISGSDERGGAPLIESRCPGYQRCLEAEGQIERLTLDEDVERATREPPPDTRARIRGYYIRLSPMPDSLHVNWNVIELLSPARHIPLPDPFYHRLPGD
jgi:hypothetical protein